MGSEKALTGVGTIYSGYTGDSDYASIRNSVQDSGDFGNVTFADQAQGEHNRSLTLRYGWMNTGYHIFKSTITGGSQGVPYEFFISNNGNDIAMSWGNTCGKYGTYNDNGLWTGGNEGTQSENTWSGGGFGFILAKGTGLAMSASDNSVLIITNTLSGGGATGYYVYDCGKSSAFSYTNNSYRNTDVNYGASSDEHPYAVVGPIFGKTLDSVPLNVRVLYAVMGNMGTHNVVSISNKSFFNIAGLLIPG